MSKDIRAIFKCWKKGFGQEQGNCEPIYCPHTDVCEILEKVWEIGYEDGLHDAKLEKKRKS